MLWVRVWCTLEWPPVRHEPRQAFNSWSSSFYFSSAMITDMCHNFESTHMKKWYKMLYTHCTNVYFLHITYLKWPWDSSSNWLQEVLFIYILYICKIQNHILINKIYVYINSLQIIAVKQFYISINILWEQIYVTK